MADRYWVGGTANWDGTAGTKWATTSGGAGGASVPTSADDVFFDAASGTVTCTLASGNTGGKSINFTGFTGTFTGSLNFQIYGSITLDASMTYTHTGVMNFNANATITTAGKTFSAVTVGGNAITVQLADALNISTRAITVTQGTFTTNNYNVNAGSLLSSNTNTRTINLGSSTVTLSSGTAVTFTTSTNLTFNAGTSQITCTGTSVTFAGGGQTFNNVSFTGTSGSAHGIEQANTFNNLTIAGRAGAGVLAINVRADQTINGTLTLSATSDATIRTFVRSDTIGTTRTLTCNAVASLTDIDFRDITIAGSAAPVSGTRLGDCKGNSGITFDAAKTSYLNQSAGTTWSSANWADSIGGTPSVTFFPLAQDTVIFPSTSPSSGQTMTINAAYNIGTIDMSARTSNTMTLACSQSPFIYGNWINGTGTTLSGTGTLTFAGRGTQTFTSAGKTITFPIAVEKPAGTFQLGDAYSSTNTITLTRGTFDAVSYAVTCTRFISSNDNTRTLNMGSGLWTLSGTGTVWDITTETNMTLNKGTADILLSNTSTSSRTFSAGTGFLYNKLTIGGATGTSTLTFQAGATYEELASTKTVAHTILFQGTATKTFKTWSVTGSAGNVVTVQSNSTGTQRTNSITNVTSGIDYLAVKDINIVEPNRFYVGANSTDNGNNTNVYFTVAPAPSASNSNFFLMFG